MSTTEQDPQKPENPAFTTPEERAIVLQEIRDGGEVPLGTAMAHARGMNLGVWGDREQLKYDCAALLVGELRCASYPTPTLVMGVSLEHAIRESSSFWTAFEHARYERELRTENDIRSALGQDRVHWDAPEGSPADDYGLVYAVASELGLT